MPNFSESNWSNQIRLLMSSIWLNQRMFWVKIRPYLNIQQHRNQAIAGGVLIATVMTLGLGVIIQFLGLPINWFGTMIGMLLGLTGLLVVFRRNPEQAIVNYLVFAPVAGIMSAILVVLFSYAITHQQELDSQPRFTLILALMVGLVGGIIVGIGFGVHHALHQGRIDWQRVKNNVQIAILGFIFLGIMIAYFRLGMALVLMPAQQLGNALGITLGGTWALRQVPDLAERQQLLGLAEPINHSPR